ncbi:TetR/AcrR family transcriptional regulator, partial [Micromonospora sp. KC721]
MARCTQCRTEVDQSERGRPRRYCSRSCQARAYRARRAAPPPG